MMATLNLNNEENGNNYNERNEPKPLSVLQETNLDQLVLLDEVRVAPDGGEDDDLPLLALELLSGSHHHLGGLSQLGPDLLALTPVRRDHLNAGKF